MIKQRVDVHNNIIDEAETGSDGSVSKLGPPYLNRIHLVWTEMESATNRMSGETIRIIQTVEASRSGNLLWWAVVVQLALLVYLLYRGL